MNHEKQTGRATIAIVAATLLVLAACRTQKVVPLDVALSRNTRLLVVAPHPDDETIGAAGLIRRVRSAGGTVKIALTTSGDGFAEGVVERDRIREPTAREFRDYGRTREQETVAAMGSLNVPATQITFLGFPDLGLCLLASRYLSARARPFESPYTDRATPPADEQLIRGVRYRGTDVERELARIIAEFDPTLLVVPHPEDEHPDHCATYLFATEALRTATFKTRAPRVLHYLVHYGQWPTDVSSALTSDLEPPLGFPEGEGRWASLALTPEEAAAKKTALVSYATQMQVIRRFLLGFARTNELFLTGTPGAPECWCDAENVATTVPQAKRRGRRRSSQ